MLITFIVLVIILSSLYYVVIIYPTPENNEEIKVNNFIGSWKVDNSTLNQNIIKEIWFFQDNLLDVIIYYIDDGENSLFTKLYTYNYSANILCTLSEDKISSCLSYTFSTDETQIILKDTDSEEILKILNKVEEDNTDMDII